MYRQEGDLDLSSLSTALLEFVFPVKLGEKWYRSDEKARLNPTYADDWMLRKVTKVGTVVVPAGEFNDCFFLEEEWAGTTFETWFCPNVGIVDEKGDHHGTPYGFRQVLIRYQLMEQNLPLSNRIISGRPRCYQCPRAPQLQRTHRPPPGILVADDQVPCRQEEMHGLFYS